VFDTRSWKELFSRRPANGVAWLSFSPIGQLVVCDWHEVRAVDATSGKDLGVLFKTSGQFIRAISSDQKRVIAVNPERTVKVLDASNAKELFTLTAIAWPFDLATFSPDNRYIVTGYSDCRIWNAANGQPILSLKGHEFDAHSVAFSPGSKRVITGSDDTKAMVWETATGKALLTLKGHTGGVWVAISSDGKRIVTASLDKSIRIWEAATKEQVATWRREEEMSEETPQTRTDQPAMHPISAGQTIDSGEINQWLVLAPIPFQGPGVLAVDLPGASSNTIAALERETVPYEAELRPRAGETVVVDGVERVWTQVKSEQGELDFNNFVGAMTEWSIGYAVSYVQCTGEHTDVVMKVTRDDYAKLYLNGKEIYRREDGGPAEKQNPDTIAGVHLRPGNNTLVLKVANEEGGWFASVRFTDAAGQPLKGIHVTLTPTPADR
jgi:hypothetical protein